jgi:hypothetical protein
MTVTIYPSGKKEISACIEDGTQLDRDTRMIMEFILCHCNLGAMGVHDGDFVIKKEDEGLELAVKLLEFEIFKEMRSLPNNTYSAKIESLGKLKGEIEAVINYSKLNGVDIIHFAD